MADNLKEPAGAQTFSASKQSLKTGPSDMPNWGGSQGREQVATATRMNLSRTPNPVAQFGMKPGMGTTQVTSTQMPLSRSVSSPYEPVAKTKPKEPIK
jgi:hypothetical protein